MAEIKKVSQIFDLIEVGVTFPIRCRLDDGGLAIVKYQRNPVGTAALINEFVGNSIAQIIGLTIPEFGICNLSEEVIADTNQCEDIGPENSGIAFYSEFIGNSAPVTSNLLKRADNQETEKLLLFDQFIKNDDRHNGNLIAEITSKRKIYFIDCSHFLINGVDLNLPLDMDKELANSSSINPHLFESTTNINERNVYSLLCNTMGYDEKRLFAERDLFSSRLSEEVLDSIKNDIPSE